MLAQAEALVGSSDGRSLPVQLKEVRIWVSFGCGSGSSWTDLRFLDLRQLRLVEEESGVGPAVWLGACGVDSHSGLGSWHRMNALSLNTARVLYKGPKLQNGHLRSHLLAPHRLVTRWPTPARHSSMTHLYVKAD